MSLMATVTLKPKRSVSLAFVTAVGRSRSAAVELARRYGSMHAVRWAFRDAEQESPRRLQRTRVDPALPPAIQRLFSALLFADPALRSASDIAAARPCQTRLWGRGISGDDPIVLVRVHDPEVPLLGETLAAQRYLRSCGVRLDLVLVDELASGYASEGSGTLRGVLARNDTSDWIGRHGGIFVLAADQVAASERRHIEASARVVLDTRDGSLASWAGRPADATPTLPRFEATLVEQVTAPSRPRPELLFDNGLGGFTPDGREYVVIGRARSADPGPVVQRAREPRIRLPGERVVAGRHVVAQQRREPAHAVEKRPGVRHPVRGPVPARRGDRGGVVADALARRQRRRDAGPARRRIHRVPQRYPRPRAVPDRVRPARRPAQGGAPPAQEPARTAPAADRDLLRRVGAGKATRGAAAVYRVRVRWPPRVPAGELELERGSRRPGRVPRLAGRGARLHHRPHGVSRSAW